MKWTTRFLVAALGLFLLANPVSTCCMVPTTYPGDVDQARQDVLILHHDGHEELVLRVAPTFPESEEGPERLAWLITVPSKPTGYREVDGEIFDEAEQLYHRLENLADDQKPKSPSFLLADSARAGAVESLVAVSAPIRVGAFEITEVEAAKGEAGAEALNTYLEGRGYPAEDVEELLWFTERAFTFLCVDVSPKSGERFGARIEMPALQVGFDSDRLYYPAKYSARQGEFALGLTVISSAPLDRESLREVRGRLRAHAHYDNLYTSRALPKAIEGALKDLPGAGAVERWHVNALPSAGFNRADPATGEPAIMGWDDDIFLEVGDDDDLPPGWFYGDGEATLRARVIGRSWLVVALGLLVALISAVWLAYRLLRRRS